MIVVTLNFHSGPLQGRELRIQGQATIGRAPLNDIVLNDPMVSSRHCAISCEAGQVFLKDLHSANGTVVNGRPIEAVELHDGDMLVIGVSQIKAQLGPVPAVAAVEPSPVDIDPPPVISGPEADGKTNLPAHAGRKLKKRLLFVGLGAAVVVLVSSGLWLVGRMPAGVPKPQEPAPSLPEEKSKSPATWKALERKFKPQGDKEQRAKQRIAFLEQLIARFPADKPNILSACLDLAGQYKTLNNPQSSIRYHEQFLDQSDPGDKRRAKCMGQLIRTLVAAGEPGKAGAFFERFYSEKPAEACATAEKICAEACAGGRPERIVKFVQAFQACLLRQAGDDPQGGEWDRMLALSRYERRARTALWMGAVKNRIPWDHDDEQTLLTGILGDMRSADCLVKATLTNKRLIGEGVDVSGRFEDHSFIMASQYACKADLLMHWYGKTGFAEYRTAAAGFIGKLYKLYTSSKDVSGKNWLPLGKFVDENGKAWSYFGAPKLDRGRDIFPWDQSRSSHNTHHDFMDAWGLGMWELSKSAALLAPADRQKLVELLKGVLDFCHRPYMLKDEEGAYYWRTDAFCPLNPPESIPAPSWDFLGVDVIHAVLALRELGEDTQSWRESMQKFAAWYMQARAGHNDARFVEYTDLRAFDLAEFLDTECKDPALKTWLAGNLPALYAKRRKDVSVVLQGGALVYSTMPVMDMMARLDPEQYRKMWHEFMRDHVTPYGLYQDGEYPTINISQVYAILDSMLGAWRQGALSAVECRAGFEQILLMWGNPHGYRDVEDWVIEPYPFQRKKRAWEASPYPGYPENVRPEAYYRGLPQAYMISLIYGGKSDGTFEREDFNCLVQYTAPGGQLTERIHYGRMSTFSIMDTRSQASSKVVEQKDLKIMEVECVMPDVPAGTPCVGIVKVTPLYYRDESWHEPTGYRVREILHDGRRIPFKVYGMFGYMEPPAEKDGNKDNVKAGFLIRATKPGRKITVRIVFAKAS